MKTFRFTTDLECHLATGETTTLRRYQVAVEADTADQAQADLKSIATEMVHDAGSKLLDAPLDYLVVLRATLIPEFVHPRDRAMLHR